MKKIILIAFACLLSIASFAQPSLENFTNISSEGEMPEHLKDVIKSSKKENISIKRFLNAGLLIYGSPLNQYLDKIADNLLKDYPEVREQIHIYVLRSPVVNASITDNGTVFVNCGLLAQAQNESEIAFILAHEITHFAEKHIEKREKIKTEGKKKKKSDADYRKSQFVFYHNRSREHENEADQLGFERYYKKSPYSFEAVSGVFDVLQYGYLPFDEIKFTRDFVETEFYQFPTNYFLTNLTPIRNRENYIDTLSTHPNLLKRREAMAAKVNTLSDVGRQLFIQPESLFYQIRDLARFECINFYLTTHSYGKAFYNTYVLLQLFPDNEFLHQALAVSLYGLAKHKSETGINNVLTNYKVIEGEQQQANYFLSKLSREELSLLAIRFGWQAYKNFPDNLYLRNITKDLVKDMHEKKRLKYVDYSDYPMGIDVSAIPPEEEKIDTTQSKSKYDKIKQQGFGGKVIPTDKFRTHNYMLVDLRQDEEFMNMLESALKEVEDKHVINYVKEIDKNICSNMLIWTPNYYVRSNKGYTSKSRELEKMIKSSTRGLPFQVQMISDAEIASFSTERYNQFTKMQFWSYDYLFSENVRMIYYQSLGIEEACKEFGTSCINFVNVTASPYGTRFWRYFPVGQLIGSIILFLPSVPVVYGLSAIPKYSVNISFVVINLETNEVIADKFSSTSGESLNAMVGNAVYKFYYEFSKKGGRK